MAGRGAETPEGGWRMTSKERACKECHQITGAEICPICHLPTSYDWSGYLVIIDVKHSLIAKSMGINLPGRYALKVR